MPKQNKKKDNIRLAGVFIAVVLGLIFLSFLVKFIFIIKDSKFDGSHKFNVLFQSENQTSIVSFSPQSRSISILNISNDSKNILQVLKAPVDGSIKIKGRIGPDNLSTVLIKSELPLGNVVNKLTFIDLIRLAFFSRTVSTNSIYERSLSNDLEDSKKNTLLSLTFSDPDIYKENQSVEIVNTTGIDGLGARMAQFITNIGGNPILVSGSNKKETNSRIIYYGKDSYTVNRLSTYFNLLKEKTDKKGIADVIIIIGNDLKDHKEF